MHACLPNELLVHVIEYLFEEPSRTREASSTSLSVKPPWSRVEAVVLTSWLLREIGLRLWFTHLRVRNEWNWEFMSQLPAIYDWVKVITYYNGTSFLIPDVHPSKFRSLESVSFRMFDIDRPTRALSRLPRSLNYLELWTFDTMVHQHLFSAIAASLPDLRELRLHAMSEVDKYGLGTHFPSADAFGRSLARSLSKMQKLEVLAMDVYLTPSAVPLHHASCPPDLSLFSCGICVQKFGHEADTNEISVSLVLATNLGNLKRAEWCSCFSPGCKSIIRVRRDDVVSVSKQIE